MPHGSDMREVSSLNGYLRSATKGVCSVKTELRHTTHWRERHSERQPERAALRACE
jgi:hypothetical protein